MDSRVGYGEGLYLKRHVTEKVIVAFYNGLRLPGLEPEDASWEDRGYRIMVGEDARMDVPEAARSTLEYRASLGHKIQHSFSPNCEFWEVPILSYRVPSLSQYCRLQTEHPVFGHIPCIRTLVELPGGVEITVNYNYMLDDCPQWYSELWDSLQRRQG